MKTTGRSVADPWTMGLQGNVRSGRKCEMTSLLFDAFDLGLNDEVPLSLEVFLDDEAEDGVAISSASGCVWFFFLPFPDVAAPLTTGLATTGAGCDNAEASSSAISKPLLLRGCLFFAVPFVFVASTTFEVDPDATAA